MKEKNIISTNNNEHYNYNLNSKNFNDFNKSELLRINEKNIKNKNNRNKNNRNKNKKAFQNPILYLDYKILNKNYINLKNKQKNITISKIQKIKSNKILNNNYSLIQIDANNSPNTEPITSNFILDIYDYETAIQYDKRKFIRIFYITILGKENIINIILFKTPLDIQSLLVINFIFTYSCDLAFNLSLFK